MSDVEGTNLSREEMLELAQFEVLGVLDAVEAANFERAFAQSTPSLQAEIIALQARIAEDPILRVTSEQPSQALSLRTMARIVDAMDAESRSAQPIATIGPRTLKRPLNRPLNHPLNRHHGGAAGASRISADDGRSNSAVVTEASMREIIAEVAARNANARPQKQLFWRAASFFLFAGLCVALYFNQQVSRTAMQLAASVNERALSPESLAAAREIAPFDIATAQHVDLTLAIGESRGHAHALLHRVEGGTGGRVLVQGIGANRREVIRVVVKDRDGKVLTTRQSNATEGGLFAAYIEIDALPAAVTIEVELESGATFRATSAA
ncbi:MAG: hypothetical protein RL591_2256 [Planctomycetota bacterium]